MRNYLKCASPDDNYLYVKFILRRQNETGQFGNPEAPVLVEELSMDSDSVPRPHITTSSHILTHHEVVREAPPTADYTKLRHLCITVDICNSSVMVSETFGYHSAHSDAI